MPGDVDPATAVLSMRRLKAIRDFQEVTLLISHDPEDWAAFPHAPTPIE
jgi:N-acyl homoserine lactone hydrolase